MNSMGEMVSDQEVDELLKKWDVNGDGSIDYKEFCKAMMEDD